MVTNRLKDLLVMITCFGAMLNSTVTNCNLFISIRSVGFGAMLNIMKKPNIETLEALNEVEMMKKHPENFKGYDDIDEMIAEGLAQAKSGKGRPADDVLKDVKNTIKTLVEKPRSE